MTAVGLTITVSYVSTAHPLTCMHKHQHSLQSYVAAHHACLQTISHIHSYTQTYTYLAGLQPGFCHLHDKASVVKLVTCTDISGSQDIDIMHVCQIQSAMKLATLLGKLKQRAIYLMTKTCLTHGCFFTHHA